MKKGRERLKDGGNSPGVQEKQLWAIDPKKERDARKRKERDGKRERQRDLNMEEKVLEYEKSNSDQKIPRKKEMQERKNCLEGVKQRRKAEKTRATIERKGVRSTLIKDNKRSDQTSTIN